MKKLAVVVLGLYLLNACTAKQAETIGLETFEVSSPIQLDTLIQQEFVADILRSELELLEISRNQWMRAINLYRVLDGGW